MWGRLFARISKGGPSAPANYCQTILFEETRNLDLFKKYKSGALSIRDQVYGMILSRKKWELDYMKDHFVDWNNGLFAYYYNKEKWCPEYMVERIASYQTPAEAYEILFYVSQNKEAGHNLLMVHGSTVEELFWAKIESRAVSESNEMLKEYLTLRPSSYYQRMVALELAIGYWDEQANEYYPEVIVDKNYIPSARDYGFDCHSFIGLSRLKKHWSEMESGKFTKSSKLDLRWSGILPGILRRFECYKQHGLLTDSNGKDVAWNDVKLDPDVWKKTFIHDSYYYEKYYLQFRSCGYAVPVIKQDIKVMSMEKIMETYGGKGQEAP